MAMVMEKKERNPQVETILQIIVTIFLFLGLWKLIELIWMVIKYLFS